MALPKSEKMDRAGVRTAADIEQKYNFGKSFAETMGLAKDARTTADEALEAAKSASNIDYDKVFEQITQSFQKEGVFTVDGHIYINGSRIKMSQADIENLFANNINMKGTFTHTVDAFLYPGEEELEALEQAFSANVTIPYTPLWDFNSDGKVDGIDVLLCRKAIMGLYDLSTWSGAVKKPVTMTINLSNPDKAISFYGENMWGRTIEGYIGVNSTNIKNPDTEKKISDLQGIFPYIYTYSGGATYETVIDNWHNLPNIISWSCSVYGAGGPFIGSAFGNRVDDYGAFIYFDYAGVAKFITVGLDGDGIICATSIRDI